MTPVDLSTIWTEGRSLESMTWAEKKLAEQIPAFRRAHMTKEERLDRVRRLRMLRKGLKDGTLVPYTSKTIPDDPRW